MQIDTHITLGNIASMAVFVFAAGGAWMSIRNGQESAKKDTATINAALEEIKGSIATIRDEYLSAKDQKLIDLRISTLENRIAELEQKPKRR